MKDTRWRRGYTRAFVKNHCAIDAVAQAAGMNMTQARQLAQRARLTPSPHHAGEPLLLKNGGANISEPLDVRAWGSLAGLAVSHPSYYLRAARPTLAQFCRVNRVGTHLALVRNYGHIIVVINGKPYGWYQMRSRVARSFVVTQLEAP